MPEEHRKTDQKSTEKQMIREIYRVMMNNKKWWILPIIIIIGLLCLFISLNEQKHLLPYIYAVL